MTKPLPPTPRPLTTASLFSGIAGIECGLARAQAAVVTSFCERWDPARDVLRAHFPYVPLGGDVTSLRDFGGAELVTAGFPCTDLSQAGLTRGIDGLQSGLVLTVLGLVYEHRPAWVMLENVPNMLLLSRGRAMARIVEELESAGYQWAYRVLDSRFTGLAQRRRRVILLASTKKDPAPVLFAEDAGAPPMASRGPRETQDLGGRSALYRP
jgi:DNA (cytosine-5)-methyltransferase 1